MIINYSLENFTAPAQLTTARVVVGSSKYGCTSSDVDYLCDTTKDDLEIQAALNSLPSTGGEVLILNGTYNITKPLIINKPNVSIVGNGASTILRRMATFANNKATISIETPYAFDQTFIYIESIKFDGNDSTYGVTCPCIGRPTSLQNPGECAVTITECFFVNSSQAISLSSFYGSQIYNNFIEGYTTNSFNISANGNIYSNILSQGNGPSGTYGNINNNIIYNGTTGIDAGYNQNTDVSNNYIYNMDNCIKVSVNGFYASIDSNICKDFNIAGIILDDSVSQSRGRSIISNNICIRGTGLPSDYSESQHTIYSGEWSRDNNITGNLILGKNVSEYMNLPKDYTSYNKYE